MLPVLRIIILFGREIIKKLRKVKPSYTVSDNKSLAYSECTVAYYYFYKYLQNCCQKEMVHDNGDW